MKLRWKQGTGQPPRGAFMLNDNPPIWQVMQYYVESPYHEDDGYWENIPVGVEKPQSEERGLGD